MAVLGVTFLLLPFVGVMGIAVTLVTIVAFGLVGGAMYSASLGDVISGSSKENAQLFAGVFETLDGAGAMVGILMSGAITSVLPYAVPYFVNFVILLASITIVFVINKKWE
jgi:MFS family permease